jgi:hypothetical protein
MLWIKICITDEEIKLTLKIIDRIKQKKTL